MKFLIWLFICARSILWSQWPCWSLDCSETPSFFMVPRRSTHEWWPIAVLDNNKHSQIWAYRTLGPAQVSSSATCHSHGFDCLLSQLHRQNTFDGVRHSVSDANPSANYIRSLRSIDSPEIELSIGASAVSPKRNWLAVLHDVTRLSWHLL